MDLESNLKNEHVATTRRPHGTSARACRPLYSEIVDKMHDPEAVAGGRRRDHRQRHAGMTAKVLKLVNSAFFGLRREVSSPAEAVSYLGLDTIKSLVLSMHAFPNLKRRAPRDSPSRQTLGSFSMAKPPRPPNKSPGRRRTTGR
jgi:hypothetical protein